MKILRRFGLVIVLALMLTEAVGPRGILPQSVNGVYAAPLSQDTDATLRIVNDSDETICYVFISPVTASEWGDDWLGGDIIPSGATYSFFLSAGNYDVLLENCDENVLLDERGIAIFGSYDLRFTVPDLCETLKQEGLALDRQARYSEALNKFQDALTCYRDVGDRAGEGTALNNIGGVYKGLGQYKKALDYYEQSLAIWREIGNLSGEGATLNNIGSVYHSLGQYEGALDYYQQSLGIYREIGNLAGEGVTLNNIGGVYHSLGRYEEALDYFEKALTIWRDIGDLAGEGATLNNIGDVYHSLGQYEEALDYLEQALVIWREIGNLAGEGATLNNIGDVYGSLGRYEEALDYFEQALAIAQEIGYLPGEGATLNNIGGVYGSLGRYEEALDYFEQALAIAQEIGYLPGEGATLNNIAGVYKDLGRYEEALDYYKQALAIARDIGDRPGEAATLNNIGGVYKGLEQYEKALDYFRQAHAVAQDIGDRAGETETLNGIGSVYKSLHRYEEALDYYEQAISLAETLRGEMVVEEFKSGFAARQAHLYDGIIDLLVRMERPTEAFDYVQRAKARTLLDQLGNLHVNPLSADDLRLIEEEEALRGEIQALDAQLREEWAKPPEQRSEEAIRALTVQLEEKRDAYEELLLRIKLENPEYASLVTVNTLTLTDTQALLAENVTLVEYYVLPERTLAFVVTEDGFHSVSISVTQESLVESVQALYAFPSLEGVPPALQTLHQDLITPVAPYVHTNLVVIAPHGVLHYVPFAALHDGEHYLVERYTLFYTPSASVLPFALEKRKATVAPPLILGDPDGSLPHSRLEAQAIAGLYGVTAYVGAEAQERLLWEEGGGAGILHLSTHGFYDARSPLFSHVVLAPDEEEDGRLDVYEIYNRGLNLENADLVVLSACQTNVGELSRGDEIVGLNRALIYAGSPSVMASLWSVDDASTRELMGRFYTHLQGGMSKAGALRAAQMEMIAEGEYAHPYYWAAFGVTGDPGEGGHVLPEMIATATPEVTPVTPIPEATPTPEITPNKPTLEATLTPEDSGESISICPAAVLPLALVVLVGVRRKRR